MTKFFEIFGKVSLVLLILGSLTYIGFYFGKKTNTYQRPMAVSTQLPTIEELTPNNSPLPSATPSTAITISAGLPKSVGLSFDQYSILVPEDWKSKKSSQSTMDEKLTLEKDGYIIDIFQAATGGALCLYPGDADFEGPSSKFDDYLEFKTRDSRSLRRSGAKIVSNVNPVSFTICQKAPDNSYQQPTSYGHISVKLPANWDQSILDEIDKIISSLKKN